MKGRIKMTFRRVPPAKGEKKSALAKFVVKFAHTRVLALKHRIIDNFIVIF